MWRTCMKNRCFHQIYRIHMRNIEPKLGYFFADSFQVLYFVKYSEHFTMKMSCYVYIFGCYLFNTCLEHIYRTYLLLRYAGKTLQIFNINNFISFLYTFKVIYFKSIHKILEIYCMKSHIMYRSYKFEVQNRCAEDVCITL